MNAMQAAQREQDAGDDDVRVEDRVREGGLRGHRLAGAAPGEGVGDVIDDGPEGRERLRELDEGILAGLEGEYGLLSLGELGDVERGLGRGGGEGQAGQREGSNEDETTE